MGHGERYRRLPLLVVMFLVLMFLYGCQAVFTGDAGNFESQSRLSTDSMPKGNVGILGALGMVASFIGFLFGGLVLSAPEFPIYFSVLIYPIYFIVLFVFWFAMVDTIMDYYETFVPL